MEETYDFCPSCGKDDFESHMDYLGNFDVTFVCEWCGFSWTEKTTSLLEIEQHKHEHKLNLS